MAHNQNAQIGQPVQLVNVSAKEFAAKYSSKREVYNFLAVDCGVYLPHYGKWPPSKSSFTLTIIFRASIDLLPEGPEQQQEEA